MSNSKTVLIINNGTSGLYGFRRELIEELVKRCRVVLLAHENGNRAELEAMGCVFVEQPMESHGTNPLRELSLVRQYRARIREIKPDLVLTYTIKPNVYGGMACAALGVPYVPNITGLGTAVENGGLIQRVTIPLYRFGLRKAQKVFFQNEENRAFMLRHHMLRSPSDLLPGSGVNLERFPLLPYPEGETVDFCFISRLMKEKGIEQYLDAAEAIHAGHPETRFHLYGSGGDSYKARIEALEKKGAVVFHGYAKDVLAVHRGSCCTVHPTYYPEGMSNVLLESCACGRPIITTDRAGCREIVDDGVNGFVVRQRDSADLIEKLERFLTLSREERQGMGLAGRAKVEREFDRRIVVGKYLEELPDGL